MPPRPCCLHLVDFRPCLLPYFTPHYPPPDMVASQKRGLIGTNNDLKESTGNLEGLQ